MKGLITILNLYEETRFIVSMLVYISKKTVPFLIVYVSVICFSGIIFTRTGQHGEEFLESEDDFNDLHPVLKVIMTSWNMSLGYMEY